MYKIKTEDVYEGFSKNKEMFDFRNCSAESKHYDNSEKLVVDQVKHETGGATVK